MRKLLLLLFIAYTTAFAVFAFYLNCGLPTIANKEKDRIYFERIRAARGMFKMRPNVKSEPKYRIVHIKDYRQAEYKKRENTICIYQDIVAMYTLEELAGVIAHEMAHAELMEKNSGRGKRPHWQIDARAAEFVGKSAVIDGMKRTLQFDRNFQLQRWPFFAIFPMAIPLYYEKYAPTRMEMEERIKKIEGLN